MILVYVLVGIIVGLIVIGLIMMFLEGNKLKKMDIARTDDTKVMHEQQLVNDLTRGYETDKVGNIVPENAIHLRRDTSQIGSSKTKIR